MRLLTHIDGQPMLDVFRPPVAGEPWIKFISCEETLQAKQTLQDLPGEHGGVQGTPLHDVRRFTVQGVLFGSPANMDEPMRVLRRVFALGTDADDTITLGFTEGNFPGAGPHWTVSAMVTDFDFSETGVQHVKRWQALLTAADPHLFGRTYGYTLAEGYAIVGRTYPKTHPYAYRESYYAGSKTVFLEGSAPSKMKATIHGPAVNPKLLNATTGEYLLIAATLGAGDTVTIAEDNTVRLNGQFRNSLRRVGTKLPALLPGINQIVLTDDTSPAYDPTGPTADVSYTTRDA